MTHPSRPNQPAFCAAVDEVGHVTRRLLDAVLTNSIPRDRAQEARPVLSAKRFVKAA